MTAITHLADELASIAENLRHSTVQIKSGNYGSGSGVIWQANGLIITNAHVATSQRHRVELWDGRVMEADRTQFDPEQDLAALQIPATDLPSATIGDSDSLRVGELVMAVGNPFGTKNAVTTGIIHTTASESVIADIRLFPGNSGGPLADFQGRVIGINTMIASTLAVAVSTKTVERFLRGGRSRPYLGVSLRPLLLQQGYQRSLGLMVLAVQTHSPAAMAGVQIGDVLLGISGKLFTGPNDLTNYLKDCSTSDVLPLNILRGGKELLVQVPLQDTATSAEAV
jgi:serine protease Do